MIDCLVVGAGQSGLTCAVFLKAAGFSYQVVDAGHRVGDVWRKRPLTLRLFTSRRFCQLAGSPMPGDPDGFPSAAEFADYLEAFARARALRVRLDCRVVSVRWDGAVFVARLDSGEDICAHAIIHAGGSNQLPVVPSLAQGLDAGVAQLTAASYRDPASVRARGPVLVVGDGASGRQIAAELARTHQVLIATGRKRQLVPNRLLGRDIFWWLTRTGVLYAPTGSLVARILRRRDPVPAKSTDNRQLRAAGVVIKPRATAATGDSVGFADGSSAQVATVIWCAGYREDLSWIRIPAIDDEDGHIRHQRGKTSQPGFFVMGRKWLSCRASELILGAAADARIVVRHVADHLGRSGAAAAFMKGK